MQTKLANHRPARQKSRRPTTIRRRRLDFESLDAPSGSTEQARVNARADRVGRGVERRTRGVLARRLRLPLPLHAPEHRRPLAPCVEEM